MQFSLNAGKRVGVTRESALVLVGYCVFFENKPAARCSGNLFFVARREQQPRQSGAITTSLLTRARVFCDSLPRASCEQLTSLRDVVTNLIEQAYSAQTAQHGSHALVGRVDVPVEEVYGLS